MPKTEAAGAGAGSEAVVATTDERFSSGPRATRDMFEGMDPLRGNNGYAVPLLALLAAAAGHFLVEYIRSRK